MWVKYLSNTQAWPKTDGDFTKFGQLGDYIGGVWGTAISLVTLLIVWITWIQAQRAARLQEAITILAEMLKTHDAISGSEGQGFWSRSGTPAVMLREFSAIYKITKKTIPDINVWSVIDRIDISYTFSFYGPTTNAAHVLRQYGDVEIAGVLAGISRLKLRAGKYERLFIGHQTDIPHYLRNLFSMYTFIDSSNLRKQQKINLSKIIRTKLSNYDQALLALNVISHFGRDWERLGFVQKYKPF